MHSAWVAAFIIGCGFCHSLRSGIYRAIYRTHIAKNSPRLHTDEVLIALSMSAIQSEPAKKAFDALSLLRGCEAHSSVILSQVDADVYRKLGINLTCEPHYQVKKLYHKA